MKAEGLSFFEWCLLGFAGIGAVVIFRVLNKREREAIERSRFEARVRAGVREGKVVLHPRLREVA